MVNEKIAQEKAKARDLSNKKTLTAEEMNRRMSSRETRHTKLPKGYWFNNVTPLGGAPQRWVIVAKPA